jgi:hypothetical protein
MKSRGYACFAGAMLAMASCLLWTGPEARAADAHGHDGIYAVHVPDATRFLPSIPHDNNRRHRRSRSRNRTWSDAGVGPRRLGRQGLGDAPAFAPHRACCGQVERSYRFGKLAVREFGLPRTLARHAAKLRYHRNHCCQPLISDSIKGARCHQRLEAVSRGHVVLMPPLD